MVHNTNALKIRSRKRIEGEDMKKVKKNTELVTTWVHMGISFGGFAIIWFRDLSTPMSVVGRRQVVGFATQGPHSQIKAFVVKEHARKDDNIVEQERVWERISEESIRVTNHLIERLDQASS